MENCNHCIGTWDDGIEGLGLIHMSDWRRHVSDTSLRFEFCPKCGEKVGHMEEPSPIRRYRRKPQNEMERMMQDTGDILAADMLKKLLLPSPALKLMSGKFPEGMGSTVETVVLDRSLMVNQNYGTQESLIRSFWNPSTNQYEEKK